MADEVWLLRHAETEWSRDGKHTSTTDIPLTEHGREVAAALRPQFEGQSFAAVLCSPMSRAQETARLAGLECTGVRDDLREWDYGEYEGITTPQIRQTRPDWYLWRDGAPGGEMPTDVGARADRIIAEVERIEGTVVLVAHGHYLRVLGARWVEQPPSFGARLFLATGTISVLGRERDARVVRAWNQS
jgi:probable phosphoglycerate mutase